MEWSLHPLEIEGFTVVRARGDCDLYDAPRFKSAMLRWVEAGNCGLVLDMTEVRYLDSTGVGAIIALMQGTRRLGRELRLRGLSGGPRSVLERTGVLALIDARRHRA